MKFYLRSEQTVKKEAYENSRTKYKLLEKKRRGVKEVIWRLRPEQRQFIESRLGMPTEIYLYEVRTRTFRNVRNVDKILKELHFLNKRGKKVAILKLIPKQLEILDSYGIYYRPYKYKIKLFG